VGLTPHEFHQVVLIGFVLFVAAFPLLFWNEGRAVQTARSLEEGAGVVVSVSADLVDPANAGRLIHVNGTAKTEDVLRDDEFGVSEKCGPADPSGRNVSVGGERELDIRDKTRWQQGNRNDLYLCQGVALIEGEFSGFPSRRS
jgi:hypothetical protein